MAGGAFRLADRPAGGEERGQRGADRRHRRKRNWPRRCSTRSRNRDAVVSLVGKTPLRQLPELLRACALYVGNNSGPKHIAAALGVPTIGIHSGVVDAIEWGPIGKRAVAVRRNMTCSPCYLARLEDCPRNFACMRGLEPIAVQEVAEVFLARPVERQLSPLLVEREPKVVASRTKGLACRSKRHPKPPLNHLTCQTRLSAAAAGGNIQRSRPSRNASAAGARQVIARLGRALIRASAAGKGRALRWTSLPAPCPAGMTDAWTMMH